jgi:hypothetical protein
MAGSRDRHLDRGHRQLGICRLPEGAMGLSDARRYA